MILEEMFEHLQNVKIEMPKLQSDHSTDPQALVNKIVSLELFQPFVKEWINKKSSAFKFLSRESSSVNSLDSDMIIESSHE